MVKLVREIEAYLANNPNAADTIDGVARWWLAQQRYQQAHEDVQRALEYLVSEGIVTKTKIADGRVLYARAGRRRDSND